MFINSTIVKFTDTKKKKKKKKWPLYSSVSLFIYFLPNTEQISSLHMTLQWKKVDYFLDEVKVTLLTSAQNMLFWCFLMEQE